MTSALALCALLAGCAARSDDPPREAPFTLPVGAATWDASEPAWLQGGTLHVGDATVELGDGVDQLVVAPTGVYWVRATTLMFTGVEGGTRRVADVGWSNLVVSADRSVLATVDQSHGPTDRYGTHVMQVAVFDTRTGEQLYRTPDEEPDADDDLADLYGEIMPLLHGVSDEHVFFDGATIDLGDGSAEPAARSIEGPQVYAHYAQTLFPDGFHVGISGEGPHRELSDDPLAAPGRLSPDRSTIFDTAAWPADAVVYDAETGRQRRIDAPWTHFNLVGWSDAQTFFGVAEDVDESQDGTVRARQVVRCVLRTLACKPVSEVIPDGSSPAFLVEDSGDL